MDQEESDLHGLLNKIQCRDQAALGTFYDVTVDRVFALVMHVTANKALTEEIVSDVFMQVWRNASRFDAERASPLGWLLMMARSRAIDTLRREGRATRDQLPLAEDYDPPDDKQPNPLSNTLRIEQNTELSQALELLDARQRQMITLAFYRGMSHQNIANHTGEPLGTVKTVLRRSQEILRGALKQPEWAEG